MNTGNNPMTTPRVYGAVGVHVTNVATLQTPTCLDEVSVWVPGFRLNITVQDMNKNDLIDLLCERLQAEKTKESK